MSTTCPNGHGSEWADWCSVCGERLGSVEAAAGTGAAAVTRNPVPAPEPTPVGAGAAAGPTCVNCGVPPHEHDVFCESCGYDFASGSLPEGAAELVDQADESAAAPMHVKITVDPDFFAASVGDVDLSLPDPLPEQQIVPLAGIRILIGRTSTSRGIFPEIDVRALTDDPAVSSRHAMLERDTKGNWTLTDLGSTNGTFLTTAADAEIDAGVALSIAAGSSFYLGAWTRIELAESTS
ncbi:MAG: hypothetical protein ACI9BK_001294 [Acidimicrobiales bacterium]